MNSLHPLPTLVRRRNAGFSLVEILVGLGIGMIGMVIMLQVFTLAEGNKRNTSSGDDAHTSGAIAMYTLQRDLRQSGHGITSADNVLGCALTLRTGVVLPALAPVIINPPANVIPVGDANTDRLLLFIGSGIGPPAGDQLTSHAPQTTYQVAVGALFANNEYVIAAPNINTLPCARTMERIDAVNGANITVPVGDPAIFANDWLLNIGAAPRVLAYAIRNNRLTVCDYMVNHCGTAATSDTNIWVPIADNIVSMRAQYARDTDANWTADTYDQTTPPDGSAAAVWRGILGLRLVLVARSLQFDKVPVTTSAPTWTGSTGTGAAAINLSSIDSWQHYRYRKFETTIPLRNLHESNSN